MEKRICLICVLLLGLFSCKKEKQVSDEYLSFDDSLLVKIDYPYLGNYNRFHAYKHQDTLCLIAYNGLTHAIDFFNLSSGRATHSVQLSKEGDNLVSNVAAICKTTSGILIKELFALKLVSDNGEVTMNIPLHKLADSAGNLYSVCPKGVVIGGYDCICYDKEKNCVFMPLVPLEEEALEHKEMGCKIDLGNSEISFLKMSYPDDYQHISNFQGGYFIPHFSMMDGNRILCNFYGDARFWMYDMRSGKSSELNMPSNYTPQIVDYSQLPKSQKKLIREEYESLRFREIHYIPQLHSFVRVHYAPEEKMQGKSAGKYLMVMSDDKRITKEFILPVSFDGRYFIIDTDIIFFIETPNPDNEIKLARISLNSLCGE